ncbi:hypothetical protein B0J13DRAFT_535630 [Dactylonectria estremocensis]|uniref:Secreted protein n=1 Tax=Dactylonectria estremocensis TaxID=1079267 RepID=A0A9P9FIW5_9HYPO|nr:hypothetical protein B0J13DRAFT_535630 [Dactylonectria estremocensis]
MASGPCWADCMAIVIVIALRADCGCGCGCGCANKLKLPASADFLRVRTSASFSALSGSLSGFQGPWRFVRGHPDPFFWGKGPLAPFQVGHSGQSG